MAQGLLEKYGPKKGGGLLAKYGPAPAAAPEEPGPTLQERLKGGMTGGLAGLAFPNLAEQATAGALDMTGRAVEFAGGFGEKAVHAIQDALPDFGQMRKTRAGKARSVEAAREPGRALQAEAAKAPQPSGYLQEGARAAGGVVPLLAASAVNPALGAATLGATSGAAVESAYDRVLQETGDPIQATQAGAAEIPLQVLQAFPIVGPMGRLAGAFPRMGSLWANGIRGAALGTFGPGAARIVGETVHDSLTQKERFDLGESLKRASLVAGNEALVQGPLFAFLEAATGAKIPRRMHSGSKADPHSGALDAGGSKRIGSAPVPEGDLVARPNEPGYVPPEPAKPAADFKEQPVVPKTAPEPPLAPKPSEPVSVEPAKVQEAIPDLPDEARQIVYHGTPHSFEKFDSSKIGTGEGAQAFGHGLYFTSEKEIAEHYRNKLSDSGGAAAADVRREYFKPGRVIEGRSGYDKVIAYHEGANPWEWEVEVISTDKEGNPERGARPRRHTTAPDPDKMQRAIGKSAGHVHEVALAPKPSEMLDWDKPLSEQSDSVRAAVSNIVSKHPGLEKEIDDASTGKSIHQALSDWTPIGGRGAQQPAMRELQRAGIRGIRYPADKGKGGTNFVVFDDADVEILKPESKPPPEPISPDRPSSPVEAAPGSMASKKGPDPGQRGAALSPFTPRKAVNQGPQGPGFDAPETNAERLYSGTVNELQRLVDISERAPKKLRSTSGETLEEALSLFPGKKFHGTEKVKEQIEAPLQEMFREVKPDDAADYLMAEHVGAMKRDDMGMSQSDAAQIVAKAKAGPQAKVYQRLRDWNRAANKIALDILESGSLISPETRAAWEKKYGEDFVHLKSIPDEIGQELFGPSGFNISGPESKRRKGRDSKAGNPIAFRLMSIVEAIARKESNRVGNYLADIVRQNPKPDFWRIETDRNKIHESEFALSFKENGEQRWIVTKDQGLNDAFRGLRSPEPGVLDKLDKPNRWLHNVIIKYNPTFPLYNVPKDVGTAALKHAISGDLPAAMSTVKNALPAAKGILLELDHPGNGGHWGDVYRDLREQGGVVGWNEQLNFDKQVEAFQKATTPDSKAREFGRIMENATRAGELATRVVTYEALLRSGMSKPRAAMESRRITADFSRKGRWAPIYRRLYLFSGANVQGTTEILRSMKANPKRAAAVSGSLVGAGFMNAALSDLLGDPKELEKLSEDEKERFFGVMIGKQRIGVPAAYGFNVLPYLGHKLYDMSKGEDPGKAMAEVMAAGLNSFSPMPRGANPLQQATPSLLRPAVEIGQNRNFADVPIAPEPSPYDRNPPPQHERHFKGVSPVSKEITQGLSNVGIELSPEWLDHLAKFATGGAGSFAMRTEANVREFLSGNMESMRAQDIPIGGIGEALRPFVRQPPESAAQSLFWKTVERVETAEAKVKDGDLKASEAQAELKTAAALKAYEKPMKLLRQAIKAQEDEEKRAALEARLKRLQEQFLERARANGLKLSAD